MLSTEFHTSPTHALAQIPNRLTPQHPLNLNLSIPNAGAALARDFNGDMSHSVKGRFDRSLSTQPAQRRLGSSGDDVLRGSQGVDRILGNGGNDTLLGDRGNDVLVGGSGNDLLNGGLGKDTLTGGSGNDVFVIAAVPSNSKANKTVSGAEVITDFTDGQDRIKLQGNLKFDRLLIVQGKGSAAKDTLIRDKVTGNYLAVLKNVNRRTISNQDFASTSPAIPAPTTPDPIADPIAPDPTPLTPGGGSAIPASIISSTVKFGSGEGEAAIAAKGGARITIGTQTIYIGTQQVTGINQNPIIASFDSTNPANNWVKTDYEVTGVDGRGYGLFSDGSNLYGAFSVDGTQGTPDQDFRRAATGATQGWLRSYGQGGGAKIAVLAKIDLHTGEMTSAAHLSSLLPNGKSNSFAIADLSTNANGNLLIKADSYFAPRRPDGTALTQTTAGSSPFAYTLEITSDLKTVVSTSAVGWS